MRLFLGIELSKEVKDEIASMLVPLRKTEKGWENPLDYHLTLLFIGSVEEALVPSILSRLEKIPVQPFVLRTTNFHFFSRRIMYLGFEHSPEVYALRKEILSIYPEYHRPDEKEFIPHITVKRWQRYERSGLVEELARCPLKKILIPVKNIALFKSEKDSQNRKYHVL